MQQHFCGNTEVLREKITQWMGKCCGASRLKMILLVAREPIRTMSKKQDIPLFDFYKTLNHKEGFIFSLLEESYNTYDASSPHRHNYFEIIFFDVTGGYHEIDFVSYPIEKNTLHFVSPEQVHVLRRSKNVTGYVISFTSEFLLHGLIRDDQFPFFKNAYSSTVVKIDTPTNEKRIKELIKQIETEFSSPNTDRSEALYAVLSMLLITSRRMYVGDEFSGKPSGIKSEATRRFKALVNDHFLQHKSVTHYAKLLNITAGHLNDTIHKDIGKTASEIIHERVILEAKRLLYHSPKSVKEIAGHLHYEDPSYFTRFFKTHTGLTPEEFRKHIREKYQ